MFIYLRAWLLLLILIILLKIVLLQKNNRLNTATPTILAFYLLMLAFVPQCRRRPVLVLLNSGLFH